MYRAVFLAFRALLLTGSVDFRQSASLEEGAFRDSRDLSGLIDMLVPEASCSSRVA